MCHLPSSSSTSSMQAACLSFLAGGCLLCLRPSMSGPLGAVTCRPNASLSVSSFLAGVVVDWRCHAERRVSGAPVPSLIPGFRRTERFSWGLVRGSLLVSFVRSLWASGGGCRDKCTEKVHIRLGEARGGCKRQDPIAVSAAGAACQRRRLPG